jgi:phosphatidylethanolamine-binding protein (PEBP) family uncharacterized protein
MALSLTSPDFEHGQPIPRRCSCEGDDISPALEWAGLPEGCREGLNDWKKAGYAGPCPPIGKHRYFFKLYALDRVLGNLDPPVVSPADDLA